MESDHLNGLTGGVGDMYQKYRDIDEDELMAQMTDEELNRLLEELEMEEMNPVESSRHRVIEKDYDMEENYNYAEEDQKALEKYLKLEPGQQVERQVPEHIQWQRTDPALYRCKEPEEMDERPGKYEGGGYVTRQNMPSDRQDQKDAGWYKEEPEEIQLKSVQPRERPNYGNQEPQQRPALNKTALDFTQENRKYENDPSLPFTPSLRKATKSDINSSSKRQQPSSFAEEDDRINTNVPEEILRQVATNDPELTEINLNNCIGVPEDLWVAMMQALSRNDVITTVNISNTGQKDRVAKAMAQMLKINKTVQSVNMESNFISGDGGVAIMKAIEHNSTLRELKLDNQRHMFGQKVEQEFAKRLKNNTTLTRFGYSFQNPGIRMTCANYVTRNVDHCRKQRVAYERGQMLAGTYQPPPRAKPTIQPGTSARARKRTPPQLRDMTLPKLRGDSEDQEVAAILAKLGGGDIALLQQWLNNKVAPGAPPAGPAPPGGPGAPPPPPTSTKKAAPSSRGALFSAINGGASQTLRSTEKPKDQQLIMPDPDLPMPEEEKRRGILSKGHFTDEPTYEVKVAKDPPKYQAMTESAYRDYQSSK